MRLQSCEKEEEEEENKFGHLVTSLLSWWFFMPVGMLFVMKTLKDEWHIAIKAYKFTIFEILRFFGTYMHVCAIPT